MQQLTSGQANAEVPVNRNFQTLEHQQVYGQRQSAHSGLTWAYYGGRWGGFSVADGTLTLTDAATNYVVVAIATGVISASTATTNWNDSANYARVYRITTTAGAVSNNSGSDFDYRAGPGGAHGGSGGGSIVPAARYTIDLSSTADADPGAGLLRFNNATPTSATVLYVDDATSDAVDLSTYFLSLGATGFIRMQSAADAGEWIVWRYTAIVDATGYFRFTVTLQASLGTLDASDAVLVTWDSDANSGSGGGTKTYAVLTPMTSQPPAANFATLDTRNSIAVLDFDTTTEESAFWTFIMPEGASLGSGLIVRIHWMASTATTGDCRWGVRFERMNTDEDADSFDTAGEATTTTNGTSGIVTVTAITITTIDSIAAGEPYRVLVYRDVGDAADTMAGDAELVSVEIRSAA